MARAGHIPALGGLRTLVAAALLACPALLATTLTSESEFLAAARGRGWSIAAEGFEGDAWGASRTPASVATVSSGGFRWSSNHPQAVREPGRISTAPGPARTGSWSVLSVPHGNSDVWEPNGFPQDGWVIRRLPSAPAWYGVGGWFSGTPGAKLVLVVDGDEASAIELGPVDSLHRFYGYLAERPFTAAEFREVEGKREDQRFVFGDDFSFATAPTAPNLGVVSAASYQPDGAVAPGSLAAAFGQALAGGVHMPSTLPLPLQAGGVAVRITDSSGAAQLAPLLYVSPAQVNFMLPEGLRSGTAMIAIVRDGVLTASNTALIAAPAPGLFSADGTGKGVAAAQFVRVLPSGAQQVAAAFRCDAPDRCSAVPVNLGTEEDHLYLVVFGTGIRAVSSLAAVRAAVGGLPATVSYAGAQGQYAGLDQVNILLPRALRGRGTAAVELFCDGQAANALTIDVL